jgi:hypothetical protein
MNPMLATNTQVLFFQHIKSTLPPHISLVDDIADQLNISNDSAYRRIRGEKPISLEELGKLASYYKLSLDKFLHLENDSFIFNGRIANDSDFTYENWLETDVTHLEQICKFQEKHFYILAKEIPFLYYFYIPEVAAFKSYFFKKSIIQYDQMRGIKFSLDDDYNNIIITAKKIADAYSKIPSTEIWHEENLTSTLRQVEFYKATGNIKTESHAFLILDKLEELLNHLEMQAEVGKKFAYKMQPHNLSPSFTMYVNEIIWGDNMIYVEMGANSITYINHSILNFITTSDTKFNAYMKKTLAILAAKSTQISSVNERDRMIFFNKMRDKINATRKKLTV